MTSSIKRLFLGTQLFVLFLCGGFVLSAQIVELSSDGIKEQGDCNNYRVVQDFPGIYHFEESRYTTNFCLHIIKPSYATSVIVRFLEFNFGESGKQATNFVEISNDEGAYMNITQRRYTGIVKPFSFESYSRSITIRVHQESSYFGKGNLLMRYDTTPGCHKDRVVETYEYISLPSQANVCTWSVSLKNLAESRRDRTLTLQIWTLGAANVDVYDLRTMHFLTSFDRSDTPSRTGLRVSSSSGMMFIKYQGYQGYEADFNATVKLKGICTPGTFHCGDGENCYTKEETCDGLIQCPTAFDELGCDEGDCAANEFWCGKQDPDARPRCYTSAQRCNGFDDCDTKHDEAECHTCGHGAVLCRSTNRCIYERWLCDQDSDCGDGSDEEGCLYPVSRRVITAAIVGALVCSLLLVISLGCTCKLYSLRTAHSRRSVLQSTPLTRVEREIFARQAPPTYDMTVSGIDPEAVSARQRNRRRRSRRYPFQRSAPARNEAQVGSNREESVAANPPSTNPPSQGTTSSNTENAENSQTNQSTTNTENNAQRRQHRNSTLQTLGSFLFDSIISTSSSSTARSNSQSDATQASSSRNRGAQNQAASRNGSHRSTSSGRSRSSRSTNSDQQAKPLPKKKRIQPVRVPAPCEEVAVEEDLLACIYPTPPSYSQAVLTDEGKVEKEPDNSTDSNSDATVSPNSLNEDDDNDVTINETLTTQTKFRFSFSFSRAIQKLAASSLRRFRQNPYHQMAAQDSRRNSEQESRDAISVAGNDCSFILPVQTRGSTSSDDDLLDCSLNSSTRDDDVGSPLSSRSILTSQDGHGQVSTSKKMFPPRRLGNFASTRMKDEDCDSINMFDLSSGDRV